LAYALIRAILGTIFRVFLRPKTQKFQHLTYDLSTLLSAIT
jgi:hypothetical protein